MTPLRFSMATLLCAVAFAAGASPATSPRARVLFATLGGASEVGTAGDSDGFGGAVIAFPSRTTICFGLAVSGVDRPVAAHVHTGRAGVNGDVVIDLAPRFTGTGTPATASGCRTGILRTVADAVRAAPSGYYVNVHTRRHPAGAVRGQLGPRPSTP
jgi:hypothetical protein